MRLHLLHTLTDAGVTQMTQVAHTKEKKRTNIDEERGVLRKASKRTNQLQVFPFPSFKSTGMRGDTRLGGWGGCGDGEDGRMQGWGGWGNEGTWTVGPCTTSSLPKAAAIAS